MDQLSANETGGNRKSLVISRLELFEQINSVDRNGDATKDTRSTNRPSVITKPVSRSNSKNLNINDNVSNECRGRDRCLRRVDVNNCVNSDNDFSDGAIDVNADPVCENSENSVNANHSPVTEKPKECFQNGDLVPELKYLQIRNDLSPCSKRISYNIAVSGGEFAKIAINRHRDKHQYDNTIDESDNEEEEKEKKVSVATTEIPSDRNAATHTVDESDSEENDVKVEKTATDFTKNDDDAESNDDSTTLAVSPSNSIRDDGSSADDDSRCVHVDDINIEDLNSTKLTNDILNLISSSPITAECKFDKTDTTSTSSPNDKTVAKSNDSDYPEELNPFGDDDDDADDKAGNSVDFSKDDKISNPFGDDDDETVPYKSNSTTDINNKVNTNPFWSGSEDEDEPNLDDVLVKKTPVPLPRSVRKPMVSVPPQPSPKPRILNAMGNECGTPTNTTNVAPSPSPSRRSVETTNGVVRKLSGDSLDVSFQRSPGSQSVNSTLRKKKPAPPPPCIAVKSPNNNNNNINTKETQINEQTNQTNVTFPEQTIRPKSGASPWKNRKGPAPARPIPIRRPVKEMPLEDIKIELSDIEIRQQELDRQGKQLEQMIHDQNASNSDNFENSSSHEELVLQLFELVNEKNELLRRHSELMYMRKMHNLEEEHADIEYQLRCLMLQPESNKTDCDKTKEEELLRRLLEVVEKRNEIIEAMEKDRLRETAEDKSVTTQLDVKECNLEEKSASKKSKKKKDKVKERKEDQDSKHSPSKVIKQKFMTLRHSTKKLNPKILH